MATLLFEKIAELQGLFENAKGDLASLQASLEEQNASAIQEQIAQKEAEFIARFESEKPALVQAAQTYVLEALQAQLDSSALTQELAEQIDKEALLQDLHTTFTNTLESELDSIQQSIVQNVQNNINASALVNVIARNLQTDTLEKGVFAKVVALLESEVLEQLERTSIDSIVLEAMDIESIKTSVQTELTTLLKEQITKTLNAKALEQSTKVTQDFLQNELKKACDEASLAKMRYEMCLRLQSMKFFACSELITGILSRVSKAKSYEEFIQNLPTQNKDNILMVR